MTESSESKQLLHLVFGGALAAWKAKAQQTVDNAHMRYFIVHMHRLLTPGGKTIES